MTWLTQHIFTLTPLAMMVIIFASMCLGWVIYGLRGYKHWYKRFHRYQNVPTRRQMRRNYGYVEYIPSVIAQSKMPLLKARPPQIIHKQIPTTEPLRETISRPTAPVYSTKDDLQVVEGINVKTQELLNNNGIHTWRELSQTPAQNIVVMLDKAGLSDQDPTSWPKQAHFAETGNWKELKNFQDSLYQGH